MDVFIHLNFKNDSAFQYIGIHEADNETLAIMKLIFISTTVKKTYLKRITLKTLKG